MYVNFNFITIQARQTHYKIFVEINSTFFFIQVITIYEEPFIIFLNLKYTFLKFDEFLTKKYFANDFNKIVTSNVH